MQRLSVRLARIWLVLAVTLGLTLLHGGAGLVRAQGQAGPGYTTTFVVIPGVHAAVLYRPDPPGPRAEVAVLLMHPSSNYLAHRTCTQLSTRGYTVLCANSVGVNTEDAEYLWDDLARSVGAAVAYLRGRPDVRKVALLGYSGGGMLMTYYQNVAENGPAVCSGPEKLYPCSGALAGLTPADGLMLMDSHPGWGFLHLTYLDPSIMDEANPTVRNTALDMFDPANGYLNDTDDPTYSPEFVRAFHTAQGQRNQLLLSRMQERLSVIESGRGFYPNDEPVLVYAGVARLFQADPRLLSRTQRPHTLLREAGPVREQIIRSVRVPQASAEDNRDGSAAPLRGTTVRTYMSNQAIRTTPEYQITEDDILGIDWDSSNHSTVSNIRGVKVPLGITAMTGHYFLRTSEMIFDAAGSTDKEVVFIEGAVHGLTPCQPCAARHNNGVPYGDTVKVLYDYWAEWLASRLL